jgi:hypothetical protein
MQTDRGLVLVVAMVIVRLGGSKEQPPFQTAAIQTLYLIHFLPSA